MWEESKRAELEAEHGPVVVIGHPDGSVFAFKRMGREQYELRRTRIEKQGDADADEKLLQERVVWPSREAWNAYVAGAAFEVDAYIAAYQSLHGKREVVQDADGALTNGPDTFTFRRPTRVEIKQFRSKTLAQDAGALESLLKACATSPFGPWAESNPFGVIPFGEAFLEAHGMRVGLGETSAAK